MDSKVEGNIQRGEHTERGRYNERIEDGRGGGKEWREGQERLVLTPVIALMYDLI